MQNEELAVSEQSIFTLTRWRGLLESLIVNLSPMQKSGEVRLVAAVLAQSITDEFKSCSNADRDVFETSFFKEGFVKYCNVIGVNSDQLKNSAIESFTLVGMAK